MAKIPTGAPVKGAAAAGVNLFRTGGSRVLGMALVTTSALMFVASYVTGFAPFEIASLISFVLGVALLVVELEPRIRLSAAGEAMLGQLRALDSAMKLLNITGKATYVPQGSEVKMVMAADGGRSKFALDSVGEGLQAEMNERLGDMHLKGMEFFNLWIPRTLVNDVSACDDAKVSKEENKVVVSLSRPFVRRLCLDKFVNENVCCRMGCPLAGVVAQSLAVTTGKEVLFENCTYEPKSQVAKTILTLGREV